MSFKDEYKNQVDEIRTDRYIRQKVLKKIEEKQAEKRIKMPAFKLAAAVLCLALAVGIAIPFAGNFKGKEIEATKKDSVFVSENKATDYTDIYKKVRELKVQARTEWFVDTDDVIMYDAESTTDGAASAPATGIAVESDKSTNTTVDKVDKGEDYSETNNQVEGVDEADIVKTNGKYIYSLSAKNELLRIIKAGEKPEQVATIKIKDADYYNQNMYLKDDRLVIFGDTYTYITSKADSIATIYDVSNPENPKKLTECVQNGFYSDSRLIGNKLYMISNYDVNANLVSFLSPKSYVPAIECKDYSGAVPADSVYISDDCNRLIYTVISAYDITEGTLCSTQSILGGTYTVYCSTENIITAGYTNGDETKITRYSIADGIITLKAEGTLKGSLLNQFSIDEHNGYFRFVTTHYGMVEVRDDNDTVSMRNEQVNGVYIYDGELKVVGKIENLAPDERVYSVRFMGDIAYFVTFRQVDPLFSADLSDPVNPKIIGKLKIPGFSSYLHPYGDGKLLGIGMDADEQTGRTEAVKLSMFDISDPSNVTESAKKSLDIYYSEALDNHKAVLIDAKRNIIGFSGYVDYGMKYYIYALEKGEFTEKAVITVKDINAHSVRGIYIGDKFYIIEDEAISVYDLKSFKLIYKLDF